MKGTAVVFSIAAGLIISSHALAQKDDVTMAIGTCAADLKLPVFSSLARSTGPSVTIVGRLHVDKQGLVRSIDFEGGEGAHHAEIQIAMEQSRFSSGCVGRIVEVKFTFEISGPPTDCPSTSITFRGPN